MKRFEQLDHQLIAKLSPREQHLVYEIFFASQIKLERDLQVRGRLIIQGNSLISELSARAVKASKQKQGGLEKKLKDIFRQYFSFHRHMAKLVLRLPRKSFKSYFEVGPGEGRLYDSLNTRYLFERALFVEPDLNFSKKLIQTFKNVMILQSLVEIKGELKTDSCLACSADLLEHLTIDERAGLMHVYREIIAGGGVVILQTPNRMLGPHDISREVLTTGDRSVGFHIREFIFGELVDLFADENTTLLSPFFYHRVLGYFGPLISAHLKKRIEVALLKLPFRKLRNFLLRLLALDTIIALGRQS